MRKLKRFLISLCIALAIISFLPKDGNWKTTVDTELKEPVYVDVEGEIVTSTGQLLSSLTEAHVERVVDGDTLVVSYNDNEYKIRLIGVDTPESVASESYLESTGKENTQEGVDASNYTKSLVEDKDVYLEFDISSEDKYGRLLAYVYLEDGQMLQEILLADGYANLATYPPNVKYVEHFTKIVEDRNNAQEN